MPSKKTITGSKNKLLMFLMYMLIKSALQQISKLVDKINNSSKQ